MLRFFPVMPWSRTTGTAEDLAQIADCYMTLCGFCRVEDLDNIAAAGLQGIVQDSRLRYDWRGEVDETAMRQNIAALCGEVGQHPALYGYYLTDEPIASEFPKLAAAADAIRIYDPDAVPYINLYPNYASSAQLGVESYEDYVRRYVEVCNPPYISYDNYCLMEGWTRYADYFANLATVREVALDSDIPFWNIVLCTGHYCYRIPSEDDLMFQMYTTLAYGGQGISYFIYHTARHANYRLGPVDEFGEVSDVYYSLRRVNRKLSNIAPVVLKLQSTRVTLVLNEEEPLFELPAECEAFRANELVAGVSGGQFALGEFVDGKGHAYIMIVNIDLERSARYEIALADDSARLRLVCDLDGVERAGNARDWIGPGQGCLFRIAP